MGAPDDVVIWVAVFVLQLRGWFRGVTMSGMQPGDVVLVLFLMAFIPTRFHSRTFTCGCLHDGDFVVVTYVVLGPCGCPNRVAACRSLGFRLP